MRVFLAAAAFTILATSTQAEIYECDFSRGGAGGWVAPLIAVNVDLDSKSAMIVDGFTLQRQDGWFDAKLTSSTQKRFTVKWRLPRQKDRLNQDAHLDYRLTVFLPSLKANASMNPVGYDNNFQTHGKCKLVQN
jgi:hypothetical protein